MARKIRRSWLRFYGLFLAFLAIFGISSKNNANAYDVHCTVTPTETGYTFGLDCTDNTVICDTCSSTICDPDSSVGPIGTSRTHCGTFNGMKIYCCGKTDDENTVYAYTSGPTSGCAENNYVAKYTGRLGNHFSTDKFVSDVESGPLTIGDLKYVTNRPAGCQTCPTVDTGTQSVPLVINSWPSEEFPSLFDCSIPTDTTLSGSDDSGNFSVDSCLWGS